MPAGSPLGLADTVKVELWPAATLVGLGPVAVSQPGGVPTEETVTAPATVLLLKVTTWLWIAPFTAVLNETGFGLIERPLELPPFTVSVALRVKLLLFASVRVTVPGYWPVAKLLALPLICKKKEPPEAALPADVKSQLLVLEGTME